MIRRLFDADDRHILAELMALAVLAGAMGFAILLALAVAAGLAVRLFDLASGG